MSRSAYVFAVSIFSYQILTNQQIYHVVFYFRNDVVRRSKWYISDWVDGFKQKRLVIPAVMFLYFACLAPAVSFGTISSEITNGAINVPEYLISTGIAGMVS